MQINMVTLTVILLILKFTLTPALPWVWVFFPLWIGPAICLVILAISLSFGIIGSVVMGIAYLLDYVTKTRRHK